MTKTLIIAEKPSVARDIAQALGGFKREGEYYESEQYVLSSSVGHLLTLKNPDDVVRGKWSFAHLPAIPNKDFEIVPSDKKSAERLKMLVKLLKRKDVASVVNACDAGREGELIFRYIIQFAKCKKPLSRLWLQSMTKSAIVEAFAQLRNDESMKPLEDAARSRAEADWLIGINSTRAMTAFNSQDGGFYKTTVGRVQTPTLAIVHEREEQIRRFQSRPYWEVHATFQIQSGQYTGRWFDPEFKKTSDEEARDHRLWTEENANLIISLCQYKQGKATETTKPSSQQSPLLFDLTSLQREANARFGFTAKTTLSIAQALYEKHKVLTYPRTDSRHLPEDYLGQVQQVLGAVAQSTSNENRAHQAFAQQILQHQWVRPNKRIFNNAKVSDHFAIIPTMQMPKELSDAEQRIYDMVVKRFMAVFFPPAQYHLISRITVVHGQSFLTEGKVLVEPGWQVVYGKEKTENTLPQLQDQEPVQIVGIESKALQTKPPARYTEATLLSAMEGAGKLVDDDELREAMSERGLGTPATRATIIENLLLEQYLRREERELVPTAKARQLMTLLHGLKADELTSPELTGEWEHKLKQIEHGQLDRKTFMNGIIKTTQNLVRLAKEHELDTIPGDYITLKAPCPLCAGIVKETYRRYACTHCQFSITKYPAGRTFEEQEIEELLCQRKIGPLSGFVSKKGFAFTAILIITSDGKLEFDFGQSETAEEKPDINTLTPVATCTNGAQLFDVGTQFIAKGGVLTQEYTINKIILQQEIDLPQAVKLIETGKTDLLEHFVSNRSRRKFKAYLVLKNGQIAFEFEPKTPRKSAVKK